MSDSLLPHGLHYTRPPRASPTPKVYSNSSIESVMPSNHLILCHPLLLQPSIFPSIGIFSNESVLHISWPKYWSFSLSISPSNEYPGLISFRMDWLDLLAVQGTLKSLLQHHSSKASILLYSAFFTVQLSHPYMTPGKTIALTMWTFAGKVMFLLFNMLSRLFITFLPISKCFLISWLHSCSRHVVCCSYHWFILGNWGNQVPESRNASEPGSYISSTVSSALLCTHQTLRKYWPSPGFPSGTSDKELACQSRKHLRDAGSIPPLGRSPGGEPCSPLQYSCLENPMYRGAW